MDAKRIVVHTEDDMLDLGGRLAQVLFPNAFVALYGDLGVGKTALVRGVARRLGLSSLQSPTFTIVREYDTEPPLFHFDAYRLSGSDELYGVGYADYLRMGGVVMMEWANLVPDALPSERLDIMLAGSGDEPRTAEFTAHGAIYEGLLERL